MFEWQKNIIVHRYKAMIRRGGRSRFVSSETAKTNYLRALESKHMREHFAVGDFPLCTKVGDTSKTSEYDWKDKRSPKHKAYQLASSLDKNRNFRCAMQFLPHLFKEDLDANNNDWTLVFSKALEAELEASEEEEEEMVVTEPEEEEMVHTEPDDDDDLSATSEEEEEAPPPKRRRRDLRVRALDKQLTKLADAIKLSQRKVNKYIEKKCMDRVAYSKLFAQRTQLVAEANGEA